MVQSISSVRLTRDELIAKIKAVGITQEELETAQSQGLESFKELLEAHGIQAPNETAPPKRQDDDMNEFFEKLKALGIPESVIQQGPQAVMQYAKQHNITLPEPPAPPNGSKQGSNSSNYALQSVIQELQSMQTL